VTDFYQPHQTVQSYYEELRARRAKKEIQDAFDKLQAVRMKRKIYQILEKTYA